MMLKALIATIPFERITFYKVLSRSIVLVLFLLLSIGLILEYTGGYVGWIPSFLRYILLFALLVAIVLSYSFHKAGFSELKTKRDSLARFFFRSIRIVILLVLVLGAFGVLMVFESTDCGECAVYKAVGLGIVAIWTCIFLAYFIWAVYYYNINMGLTDEEWEKIDKAKEDKRQGNFYNQADIDEEPEYNPYKDQTFGLPAGTVRGMIAFSLLFGAIAMLVVSFGMTNEIDTNAFFWDQYDFFKTAFLMMIAFYFGSRSLEYLRDGKNPIPTKMDNPDGGPNPPEEEDPSLATGKNELIPLGALDPMRVGEAEPESPPESSKDDDFSDDFDPMK